MKCLLKRRRDLLTTFLLVYSRILRKDSCQRCVSDVVVAVISSFSRVVCPLIQSMPPFQEDCTEQYTFRSILPSSLSLCVSLPLLTRLSFFEISQNSSFDRKSIYPTLASSFLSSLSVCHFFITMTLWISCSIKDLAKNELPCTLAIWLHAEQQGLLEVFLGVYDDESRVPESSAFFDWQQQTIFLFIIRCFSPNFFLHVFFSFRNALHGYIIILPCIDSSFLWEEKENLLVSSLVLISHFVVFPSADSSYKGAWTSPTTSPNQGNFNPLRFFLPVLKRCYLFNINSFLNAVANVTTFSLTDRPIFLINFCKSHLAKMGMIDIPYLTLSDVQYVLQRKALENMWMKVHNALKH